MPDSPSTWADYITWAAARAGSIKRLAEMTGFSRDTLFNWKSGDHSPTIGNVFRVADAVGDSRRRALLAAGQLDDPPAGAVPAGGDPAELDAHGNGPTLADALAHVNDVADRLGSNRAERLRAVAEVIRAFEAAPETPVPPPPDPRRRTA